MSVVRFFEVYFFPVHTKSKIFALFVHHFKNIIPDIREIKLKFCKCYAQDVMGAVHDLRS